MNQQFPAIYEDGKFRPLAPLAIPDKARVTLEVASVNAEPSTPLSEEEFERQLDALTAAGPTLPADFSRARHLRRPQLMPHLLDTGVLLRLFDRADPAFAAIRDCVRRLRRDPVRPLVTTQNLAEFWNVSTRPATARGGYGGTTSLVEKRLQLIESFCDVLYPNPQSLVEWKRLVVTYAVQGVQVHDASIVAVMGVAGISHVLTLNKSDFSRYAGIVAETPEELLARWSSGSSP